MNCGIVATVKSIDWTGFEPAVCVECFGQLLGFAVRPAKPLTLSPVGSRVYHFATNRLVISRQSFFV